MNEEEYFEQLCSNSVDGTLTDSEKQKLEEHLAECPSCAALKQDIEQMRSLMAVDEEPPEGLHAGIMERLRQEEPVRVVKPQKPMRRMPVFTMVAAAAVVVLVVLGGGLMPAFSTVADSSGSGAAPETVSADAGGMADSEMRDSIRQAMQENASADSEAAADGNSSAAAKSGSSTDGADSGVQSYAAESDAAEEQGEADPAEQPAASGGRAVVTEEPIADSSTQAQVQTQPQPTFTLPQSLYGLRAAYCYVAIGGSDLPDIGGELLTQENGISWFRLENSMDTLQKTLQIAEKAGYTVSAYDDIGLTINSRASSWILAVADQ